MKAIIRDVPQNIKVTSIILESDLINPEMYKLFSCYNCGKSIFQYAGNVIMIVPGGTRTNVPVILKCRICKTNYLITTIT